MKETETGVKMPLVLLNERAAAERDTMPSISDPFKSYGSVNSTQTHNWHMERLYEGEGNTIRPASNSVFSFRLLGADFFSRSHKMLTR